MQGGMDPSQPWQDLATEGVWTCEVFHRFQTGLKFFLKNWLVIQSQHRHSEHSISHGSTNFSLFHYIPNWASKNWSRGIPDFIFWMNWSHCTLEAMNWEETQSNLVLYSTGRRQKEDTHNSNPGTQTDVSKLFPFLKFQLAQHSELWVFLWWGQPWPRLVSYSQRHKRMQEDKLVTAQCSPLHKPASDACGCALSCQCQILGSRWTSFVLLQTQRYGISTTYFPFTLMSSSFEAWHISCLPIPTMPY